MVVTKKELKTIETINRFLKEECGNHSLKDVEKLYELCMKLSREVDELKSELAYIVNAEKDLKTTKEAQQKKKSASEIYKEMMGDDHDGEIRI